MLRIGTRKSKLALWQAEFIQNRLKELDTKSELVKIESFGDKEQDLPIHKLGDKGVFTKALDDALLNGEIDIAVHSLKDVPTILHPDLKLAAVPERGNPRDSLVRPLNPVSMEQRVVATGSIRRKAFWKNKYPDDKVTDLRGNVPTRLEKVDSNNWHGAIFAYAGLERLNLHHRVSEVLEWIIPAPSQGAMGVLARKNTPYQDLLSKIEHTPSRISVDIERAFMNELEAGCSSPVGGFAEIIEEELWFKGAVLSLDGTRRMDINRTIDISKADPHYGVKWAQELKSEGAMELLKSSDHD